MTLTVGTKVKVTNPTGHAASIWADREGSIVEIENPGYPYPYEVKFDGGQTLCFKAEELEVLEPVAQDDPVNHPSHYTWMPNGVEVIDITKHFSFTLGNALKYIMRAGHKDNAVEDLKKALWYLEYEINALEGK